VGLWANYRLFSIYSTSPSSCLEYHPFWRSAEPLSCVDTRHEYGRSADRVVSQTSSFFQFCCVSASSLWCCCLSRQWASCQSGDVWRGYVGFWRWNSCKWTGSCRACMSINTIYRGLILNKKTYSSFLRTQKITLQCFGAVGWWTLRASRM